MSDPLRDSPFGHPDASGDAGAERDAKIESLLLAGLDRYFVAEYAQAIDIWSRALFLDRGHARARAYIERARSAAAEAQRQSDESLHKGIAAFERGDIPTARALLEAAVARGGAHDVALAFLTRIDRLSAASQPAVPEALPAVSGTRGTAAVPLRRRIPVRRRGPRVGSWLGAAVGAVVLVTAGVAAYRAWHDIAVFVPTLESPVSRDFAPAAGAVETVMVPRSAEIALERARALAADGRMYDALRALELVRDTDPLRVEADRLKADVQRQLLVHHVPPAGGRP